MKLPELATAIDNLLVGHHGLRHSLAEDHLPFTATFEEALKHYQNGPVLHLWNECRLVENLRAIWVDVPPTREGVGS